MTRLRFAYLGNFEPDHSTENHVARALGAIGHDIVRFQENNIGEWKVVADTITEYDVVLWTRTGGLSAVIPNNLKRRVLNAGQAKSVPVVGYHLDRWWGLDREPQIHTDPFFRVDLLITADGGHDQQWAAAGVKHLWMPPAVLGEDAATIGMWREDYDTPVLFVGSWREYHTEWAYRGRLVRWLIDTYGDRFRVVEGGVRGADLADLYASAQVVVGDSCLAGNATHYWSDRIPETVGRGGFLIHPDVEGLGEHYRLDGDGQHLATYRLGDFDNLRAVIDRGLNEPEWTRQVALDGRAWVLDHHTYEVRMRQLVDVLGDRGMVMALGADLRAVERPLRERIDVVPASPRPVVQVHFVSFDPDSIPSGYWDQEIVWRALGSQTTKSGTSPTPLGGLPTYIAASTLVPYAPGPADGGVVVIPGRFHADRVDRVQWFIDPMSWVVLIITSDEEALFPWRALHHPNMKVWIQTPDADKHHDVMLELFPFGPSADFIDLLPHPEPTSRPNDWTFAGQLTHERRQQAVAVMQTMPGVSTLATSERFAGGIDRADYAELMATTKVAPCPAGPATPDTFRAWEALDAGAIPVLDAHSPARPSGYWGHLFRHAETHLPMVDEWGELPDLAARLAAAWPVPNNRAVAWWRRYQRDMRQRLADDVGDLSTLRSRSELSDLITVVVPTSPIPRNPDTSVITETLNSIASRLPGAEILVMFDGVREEQEHRRADYERYIASVLWQTLRQPWVVPFISDTHQHQAGLMRRALTEVHTPLVMFVEHDTPLEGHIDFDAVARAVLGGAANVIRFAHETRVLDVHKHLVLDAEPVRIEGAPLLRTVQWSQRPHVASTEWYRNVIDAYFGREAKTMIEDVLHGVLDEAWNNHGVDGWNRWRTWLYAEGWPEHIKRSTHSDGRGEDPKFDMLITYDGAPPPGAPMPSRR